MSKYVPGQRWYYRTREEDVGSTVVIGEVEEHTDQSTVVHVLVDGLNAMNPGGPTTIGHMPFTEPALDDSVLKVAETSVEIPNGFQEGVATWRSSGGGVFEVSVADAVSAVLSAVPTETDDPFDALVIEMREKQSEEMIEELYGELFDLDQWFFLGDPGEERAPVQWEFPDGLNPKPAILAFTSRERAISAAHQLEIFPPDADITIMPATVKDAVGWISGPDCANEWLCFNLTQENFPLYVEDAVTIFKSL